MAARAICRCYPLYRTSFPLCFQASRVVNARASPRAPFAQLTTCHPSAQMGLFPAQEQTKELSPNDCSRVEAVIGSCSTEQELLRLVDLHNVNGDQAARIISRLSRLVSQKKIGDPGELMEDKRFKHLLKTLSKQVTSVFNAALVNVLKSFYVLGMEPRQPEFCAVEQEMCWRLRRLPFKHLVSLTDLVSVDVLRVKHNMFLNKLVSNLELRWTEIEDTRSVVMLITKVAGLSPLLKERLEDKALQMAEQFTLEDIRKVALALAYQNNRSVPLLRAISYHLVQKNFVISPDILLDLAFAYGKLNYHQTQLFQKIAMDLHPYIPKLAPEDVVRSIKSFAYLKWLNLPLFEAVAQYVVDNEKSLTPLHLSNIVLSFARLNFQPVNREAFYIVAHRRLEDHLDGLEPSLRLDLVWSLCVLQQASAAHLQNVLAPGFHRHFLGSSSSSSSSSSSALTDTQTPKALSYLSKLIDINTSARLECAGYYKGPFLPEEILGMKGLREKKNPTQLQSHLKQILKVVAGEEAKVLLEVDFPSSWMIDAVMVLDSDNKPLPVADFVTSDLRESKPLPPETKRLAFLRWEFQNFSNRSKDLLGRFVMARRHFQAAGFLTVDVPYYEWNDLKTERQKVAYLRDKMSKAVAEEMAK